MLFYEPLFWVVFPAVYALYLLVDGASARRWLLLGASTAFYAWSEPVFVMVLLGSAGLDYALSRYLDCTVPARKRSGCLALGVALNLAVLIFYKYLDFIAGTVNFLLSSTATGRLPLLHLALPIGVSFVVFEKITFLVDTYRCVSRRPERPSQYFLFVLFFPKLLAGPILKFHDMQDQIAAPRAVEWDDFTTGLLRFARGIGRKLLIADPLGAFAATVFSADPQTLGAGTAWIGLASFTVQIYFDFAGYSDMAIGLARLLGFRLLENFNAPYAARSITEFWQRWHISLTTWIRDYLYIPLGGNRHANSRTFVNLWICFLLSGLWHGASWTFVAWGAYNGLFLTLDRLFLRKLLARCGNAIATAVTLVIVMGGWVLFRAETPAQIVPFFRALVGASPAVASIDVAPEVPLTLAVGAAISLFPALPFYPRLRSIYLTGGWLQWAVSAGLMLVYVLGLSRAIAAPFQPFIYFRF